MKGGSTGNSAAKLLPGGSIRGMLLMNQKQAITANSNSNGVSKTATLSFQSWKTNIDQENLCSKKTYVT